MQAAVLVPAVQLGRQYLVFCTEQCRQTGVPAQELRGRYRELHVPPEALCSLCQVPVGLMQHWRGMLLAFGPEGMLFDLAESGDFARELCQAGLRLCDSQLRESMQSYPPEQPEALAHYSRTLTTRLRVYDPLLALLEDQPAHLGAKVTRQADGLHVELEPTRRLRALLTPP